jgi:DNA replication protein DnaC
MEHSPDSIERAVMAALTPAPAGALYTVLEPRGAICPEHGGYTSRGTRYTIGKGREIWTPCPECVTARAEAEREAADAEKRQREHAALEEMVGRAAIPVRFIGRTSRTTGADTAGQRAALTAARDYAENFGRHARTGESLLMLGKAGTGKSHLASAILQPSCRRTAACTPPPQT